MSFGTVLFIVFIGVVVYLIFRKKNPEREIKWLEEKAYWLYGMSMEKHNSLVLYDIHEDDEKRLKETEDKYIRLKEKYKFDQNMLLKLAIDWRDYNLNMHGKVMEWKQLGVNMGKNAYEEFEEGAREHQLVIEEIEKRFKSLLKDNNYERKN